MFMYMSEWGGRRVQVLVIIGDNEWHETCPIIYVILGILGNNRNILMWKYEMNGLFYEMNTDTMAHPKIHN